MLPLEGLKKRLLKTRTATLKNQKPTEDLKPKTRITKAFSNEEDAFLFI
jgi:hypothetical protein